MNPVLTNHLPYLPSLLLLVYSGFITIHEFQSALTGWGLDVPRAAMVTIYRHYDKSGDGRISYLEFCDAFLDKEDAGGVRAKEQLSKSASGVRFEDDAAAAAAAQ